MGLITISQHYDAYLPEDHETWAALAKRQIALHNGRISKAYLDGYEKIQLDEYRIIKMDEMSERLHKIAGWTITPVTGLIPTRDFFYMIINKKYPVNISMRKPWEMDFSEQPDIFHDAFGHLPLLTNEKFTRFLTAYSTIALKYVHHEKAIDFLGQLYWFTYEMGIINEQGENKPYGAAIITSKDEIANVYNDAIPKYVFDLDHIFRTPYNPFKLQKEYFIIDSFDDLFDSIQHLELRLNEHLMLAEKDHTKSDYSLNTL
ncbi:phenylalanine-4-hydroxylase [Chitinophaga varians]|uniref:phenylalanine-4-hydroxylase n=1 Tax=Chitinophaga varians TaxID=2202339 RepID=UPI00165F2502|nr:phenylalanine-4-hydroxylase [Chitinophaga varians]MBC9915633.1 phenylalanine-4-hydroxylase [Chitinophaga varians]